MGAPTGNEYYKIRSVDGRSKKFTPQSLMDESNKYFQWCIDNPLKEEVLINRPYEEKDKDGKVIAHHSHSKTTVNKMRAFTLHGLCTFLGIHLTTFDNYSTKDEYKDFFGVTSQVRQITYTQKFEGAAANLLNGNIIARDLGLSDKREIEQQAEVIIYKSRAAKISFGSKNKTK